MSRTSSTDLNSNQLKLRPDVIDPRIGYPKWFKDEVVDEYRRGEKTRNQIVLEYNISYSTLRKWIGTERPYRELQARYLQQINTIREMHWEGNTYYHIARVTGVPVSTVWDYINRPERHANY